jgi:hypothetical protein
LRSAASLAVASTLERARVRVDRERERERETEREREKGKETDRQKWAGQAPCCLCTGLSSA